MPPRVVLIGLPGSGKSSVGARLAARLGVPFADSDDLVEQAQGRSVAEIFAADGETGFRALEAEAIAAALAGFDGVLALGGGAVTTAAVRSDLAAARLPVVLLTASRPELLRRIGSTVHRPLLVADPASQLAALEAQRSELYRTVCTLAVETGGLSEDAVAAGIAERIAA